MRGRLEHGIDFYPLEILKGRTDETPLVVLDEEELYEALQRIFTAPETLNVVRQLRGLVSEQRAAGVPR